MNISQPGAQFLRNNDLLIYLFSWVFVYLFNMYVCIKSTISAMRTFLSQKKVKDVYW